MGNLSDIFHTGQGCALPSAVIVNVLPAALGRHDAPHHRHRLHHLPLHPIRRQRLRVHPGGLKALIEGGILGDE